MEASIDAGQGDRVSITVAVSLIVVPITYPASPSRIIVADQMRFFQRRERTGAKISITETGIDRARARERVSWFMSTIIVLGQDHIAQPLWAKIRGF